MLSKCANPVCSAPFRYLADGKLFQVELLVKRKLGKPIRKVEHFWLCDRCSERMRVAAVENAATLIETDGNGNVLHSTPIESVHAA